MNRYWMIGTKASSFIKKFIEIMNEGLSTGDEFYLKETDEVNSYIYALKNGATLQKFTSFSTANQYIEVWAALGFILKKRGKNIINTNLTEKDELTELSKIYILKSSEDRQTQRYRNTIIINSLFLTRVINWTDIENKNIEQPKGRMSIGSIDKLISSYENEIVKDRQFVERMKGIYDKQF